MVAKGSKTRKSRASSRKSNKAILTIPQLRKSFDHMDKVVEQLRNVAKHSFSDAVVVYREEWRKTFKRDLPPADAAAYLKFRYGMRGTKKTRRHKTRGGGLAIAGAPLDYQMRAGVNGVYGSFPTYQKDGLDRYYGSALTADCGKANGFPVDGSGATQAGGGTFDNLFRPLQASAPVTSAYQGMMEFKGQTFPSSDPAGPVTFRTAPTSYITNANLVAHARASPVDMFATAATR
jgi:hypothetical protein